MAGTKVRAPQAPGAGFLKATKARHAEEAIGQSEGLVTVLRLTQADLKPAEAALSIAKQFFFAREYSKAFQAAKRAESLAITLDERFAGYQKNVKSARARIASMQHLGLRTDTIEAILGRAEEKVLAGIWENGSFVPNYLEGRLLLERGEREGRVLQEKAERASNAIFMAELAIEALVETKGPADPRAFADGAGTALETTLLDATRELALGNAAGAEMIAQEIGAKASELRKLYTETTSNLDAMERELGELRGEGILTEKFEGYLKTARDLLGRGIIEPAATMATRVRAEAKALGDLHRKATTGLADAEILYGRLEREGFHSYEADAGLRGARKAILDTNYPRAIEHLDKALHAFLRRTDAKEALAKAIAATRKRVTSLRGSGLTFLPDIQEVLGRADREFREGNYSGSSEDLRIATVLLDQVTRAPTPKT